MSMLNRSSLIHIVQTIQLLRYHRKKERTKQTEMISGVFKTLLPGEKTL